MQRIALQKSTLIPNFIGSWMIEPLSLCDELITYFESNIAKQHIGVTGGGKAAYLEIEAVFKGFVWN
tara:strand:+ start:141 stop:341 length:201 start_codon:yes stop_codon:yes gene_type:complete